MSVILHVNIAVMSRRYVIATNFHTKLCIVIKALLFSHYISKLCNGVFSISKFCKCPFSISKLCNEHLITTFEQKKRRTCVREYYTSDYVASELKNYFTLNLKNTSTQTHRVYHRMSLTI